jgi:imidazolonepropionase-like amidohydrolase
VHGAAHADDLPAIAAAIRGGATSIAHCALVDADNIADS